MNQQSWTILIFCYNEAESVSKVALEALKLLPKISNSEGEVLIVDDGSTDGSREKIQELAKSHEKIRSVHHEKNLGIGEALRSGYFNANCENVVGVPADGQFDLDELLEHPEFPSKTILSFYRERYSGYTFFRTLLSRTNREINRIFCGIPMRDVNWVKAYKTNEVTSLDLKIRSSLIESEICAKLLLSGSSVEEVKSKYLPRQHGESKAASSRVVLSAAKEAAKLIFEAQRFKFRSRRDEHGETTRAEAP